MAREPRRYLQKPSVQGAVFRPGGPVRAFYESLARARSGRQHVPHSNGRRSTPQRRAQAGSLRNRLQASSRSHIFLA